MSVKIVSTEKAPAAIGPYSQAVVYGNLVYTSGQIPINPKSGKIEASSIEEQTVQVLENLGSILDAAGSGFSKVLKTTVFIKNMEDFAKVNEVYSRYFTGNFPARSCVEVSRLPKDVLVEIEAMGSI